MKSVNSMEVGIVNYGIGNIGSLVAALKRVGFYPQVIENKRDFVKANKVIFPGVGAAKPAMGTISNILEGLELESDIFDSKEILGICLGMQLLLDSSLENGIINCLGIIKGQVRSISEIGEVKVPRIGWHSLQKNIEKKNDFFSDEGLEAHDFYFAHSYYAQLEDLSDCSYFTSAHRIPAIIERNNIVGVQFHPEKSGIAGLKFLKKVLIKK